MGSASTSENGVRSPVADAASVGAGIEPTLAASATEPLVGLIWYQERRPDQPAIRHELSVQFLAVRASQSNSSLQRRRRPRPLRPVPERGNAAARSLAGGT